MTNKITLPTSIQEDLTLLFSKYSVKTSSPRTVINLIHDSPKVYPNLFIWLFDTNGYIDNQIKFITVFSGRQYEYVEQRYKYLFGGYKVAKSKTIELGWFTIPAEYTDTDQFFFTHDEIAESPFDLSKLVEIPYNGEKENIN